MQPPHDATILLVEDDPDVREATSGLLRDEGYQVRVAIDGADALQRLERMAPPDLILLDLAMPQMDGWEFCDRLRHDPALQAIPVVVLSAAADLAPASGLDALTVVEKPIHADALLALVAQHCRPTLPIPPAEPGGSLEGAWAAR